MMSSNFLVNLKSCETLSPCETSLSDTTDLPISCGNKNQQLTMASDQNNTIQSQGQDSGP